MIVCRNLDEMEKHIQNRLNMLEAQLHTLSEANRSTKTRENEYYAVRVRAHRDGLFEAYELVQAWRRHDADATVSAILDEELSRATT